MWYGEWKDGEWSQRLEGTITAWKIDAGLW